MYQVEGEATPKLFYNVHTHAHTHRKTNDVVRFLTSTAKPSESGRRARALSQAQHSSEGLAANN